MAEALRACQTNDATLLRSVEAQHVFDRLLTCFASGHPLDHCLVVHEPKNASSLSKTALSPGSAP
jgi:hypothetical protein